jgi:cytosine/adenosine deaminase-related metal-dependent hydrolase
MGHTMTDTSRRDFLSLMATGGFAAGLPSVATAAADKDSGPFSRLAIQAGWTLTMQAGELRPERGISVIVSGGSIEEVTDRRIPADVQRLALPDCLLTPGFISGHTHASGGTSTRGLIEGGRSYSRPLKIVDKLADDELDALTALNVAELIRSGCTTQVEMSLSLRQAESWVRVAERLGARGYPGGMIPNTSRLMPIWYRDDHQTLLDSEPGTLKEVAANLEFGRKNMGAADGRIMPMMCAHAADTHTPATMAALAAAARELGTGIHTHLSQGSSETQVVRDAWGMTPTQWFDSFGMLDGPFFGAHFITPDWDIDAPIMAERGGVFAHCPSAGGAGGSSMPFPEALARGVNVNIGIDTHSNDYVENLKLSVLYGQARHALLSRLSDRPTRNPTIQDALAGATTVPANGLRRPDLGRIAAGGRADLVAIDVTGPLVGAGALPPEPVNNLLYASGKSVRMTMTDGRVQVLDGQLVVPDAERLSDEGGQVMQKVWATLSEEGWFDDA